MGKTLDRNRETVRMALEPWVVEAALEQLGRRAFHTLDRAADNRARHPHALEGAKDPDAGGGLLLRHSLRAAPVRQTSHLLEPGTYCRDVLAPYQQATRFLELDQP